MIPYGHQAGDHVLREFVGLLKGSMRDNVDWLARYGGEEFLIALPETDLNGAMILAEKLKLVVSEDSFLYKEKTINITASFGVTGFDVLESCDDIVVENIINKADKYLYQAKQEGRNCVRGGPF